MKKFLKRINFDQVIINNLNYEDANLMNVLYRLEILAMTFETKGISEDIFLASIADIEFRLLRNYDRLNKIILLDSDMKWVNLVLDFKLIKLGSLRFQFFPMSYEEIERVKPDYLPLSEDTKKRFYKNKALLNLHIERNADISERALNDAFAKAYAFFPKVFPDVNFKGLVTRTWLVHPGLLKHLDKNSNIYHFGSRFETIALNDHQDQTLIRVFNTSDLETIKKTKHETSLQKIVYKHINDMGVAFGFIPWNELNK